MGTETVMGAAGASKVFSVSSAAELEGRINGTGGYDKLQPGQAIALAEGTYALSNPLAGNPGVSLHGIGDPASTTIQGQLAWNCVGDRRPVRLDGFTLDSSGADKTGGSFGVNELADGSYELRRVLAAGNTTAGKGNALTFYANSHPCRARMEFCDVGNSASDADCISTKADSSAIAAASLLELYRSEAHDCGTAGTNQALTAHNGFAVHDYEGYYHDHGTGQSDSQLVASDLSTETRLFGTTVIGGCVFASHVENCTIEQPAGALEAALVLIGENSRARAVGNAIRSLGADGRVGIQINCTNTSSYGALVEGNNVYGFSDGTKGGGIYGLDTCKGDLVVCHNTVVACRRAYWFVPVSTNVPTIVLIGNKARQTAGTSSYDLLRQGTPGPTEISGGNDFDGATSGWTATL